MNFTDIPVSSVLKKIVRGSFLPELSSLWNKYHHRPVSGCCFLLYHFHSSSLRLSWLGFPLSGPWMSPAGNQNSLQLGNWSCVAVYVNVCERMLLLPTCISTGHHSSYSCPSFTSLSSFTSFINYINNHYLSSI